MNASHHWLLILFWLLLACFPVIAAVQSYREMKRKYNLKIENAKGVGWYYGRGEPDGIFAYVNVDALNGGSEHCQIKAELEITYEGIKSVGEVTEETTMDLEGKNPDKKTGNNNVGHFRMFVPMKPKEGQTLQAILILHCWETKSWVFRRIKRSRIELQHDQKLMYEIVFGR